MGDELVLHRGVGMPTKCRSCKAVIVFAVLHNGGKTAPFHADAAGHYMLENGVAKHVGPPPTQLEIGGDPEPQRYTSHFATCPAAQQHRRGRR